MLHSLRGTTPIANAKPVRTADYSVELQRAGPASLPAIYHNLHVITVCLSGQPVVVRETALGRHWMRFAPGESSIAAAGPGPRLTWPSGIHCLYVHLHPRLVRRIGQTVHGVPGLAVETRFWLRDPVIRDIGLELHHVVLGLPSINARNAHELIIALAHHVVSRHAAKAGPPGHIGRLSIEEALDAFRENATSWDGLTALAKRSGLTRSHFSRRVRGLTGMTPHAMVLGSRVEAAKHLLEGRCSLSEVAYMTGFADQSHLTRVFKRLSGITPAAYRTLRR